MKKNSPLYTVGFMALIALVCGAGISFVQYSMKDRLDGNARLIRNRTIARAFGYTVTQPTIAAFDSVFTQHLEQVVVSAKKQSYQTFMNRQAPPTTGFIFSGMGFWDFITGIVVLSGDMSAITALEIIDQKETPGLGARIIETQFLDQFRGVPVNWNATDKKLISFGVDLGNSGKRIDAITGATQTTIALERMLNSELVQFREAYDNHYHGSTPHNSPE